MTRELRKGDLVQHIGLHKSEGDFRLGMVLSGASSLGLVRVVWSDGRVSLHADYFLKWIA